MEECKKVGVVYETTNYNLFKYLKGNRKVKYSKKLEIAAIEVGFLYQVLVNEKMEIIDGQNRLEVCKRLGMPVRFEIKKGAGDKEVESLNTTATKWTLRDYIEHYSEAGNEEYTKLGELLDMKITGNSAVIATAMNVNQSGAANAIARNGDFRFHDYENYVLFLKYVEKFKKMTKSKMSEKLFPALYKLYTFKNFDEDRFIAKLFETGNQERISLINEYSKVLETLVIDVNNHHLGTKSKNYIDYTFSVDDKKELIIVSEPSAWAKKREC